MMTNTKKAGMSPSVISTLKRVHEDLDGATLGNSPNPRHSKRQVGCSSDEEKKVVQTSRSKRWISYHDNESSSSSSEDESDGEKTCLSSDPPIGVIRGCASCEGCQKVIARWKPEEGCRPTLEDAPVYFPLESEFTDTVKYIASISAEAEQYGICRIVPPHSWCPPCSLNDVEKRRTTEFCTRVQRLDKLQVREARVKKEKKKKRSRRIRRGCRTSSRRSLIFNRRCKETHEESSDDDGHFGFEPGPTFTLQGFEKYAEQFKREYFGLEDQNELSSCFIPKNEPSIECIEGEYWRIVERATEQLEVLYGADIETEEFGSGFPKKKPEIVPNSYESSGWNLNNIARLPGSVLSFEEGKISGVLEPWLYVGMCFSSFCWHVEDHHLYSANFMHFGSPKVWYGVPGYAASKLEEAMKKHLPDLFEEQPDLLHNLITQLSPTILRAAGVPIYRAVQRPGEFVITFPKAYHAGFNCGFNCAEAVNIAPIDWLPHGQMAVELYKEQRRKTSISHDKLLLGAAKKYIGISEHIPEIELNANSSAWERSFTQYEVLLKALKDRVDLEHKRRAMVEKFVHVEKMQSDFDIVHERECSLCHYDLHLSAIGCKCRQEIYACLDHVHDLCTCDGTKKYALYRHSLSELDTFVATLEGNLHAELCNGNVFSNISEVETSMTTSEKHAENNGNIDSMNGLSASSATLMHKLSNENMKLPQNISASKISEHAALIVLSDDEDCHDRHSISTIAYLKGGVSMDSTTMNLNLLPSRTMNQCNDNDNEDYPERHSLSTNACTKLSVIEDWKAIDLNMLPSRTMVQCGDNKNCPDTHSTCKNSTAVDANVLTSRIKQRAINIGQNNMPKSLPLGCMNGIYVHRNDQAMGSEAGSTGQRSTTLMHQRHMGNEHGDLALKLHTNFQTNNVGLDSGWLQLGNDNRHSQVDNSGSCLSSQREHDLSFDALVSTSIPRNNSEESNYLSSKWQGRYSVDLLNAGRIVAGNAWCNKDAIFPAGFQSCVLFPSILDPSQPCLYVSEILDGGGQEGPLFKVSMKDCPTEVFVHPNIDNCWQMVQKRVNLAIQLHHGHCKVGLRSKEVRGYELFGFTSPHIIKAVESLDRHHQCVEYWAAAIKLFGNQIRTRKRSFHQPCEVSGFHCE